MAGWTRASGWRIVAVAIAALGTAMLAASPAAAAVTLGETFVPGVGCAPSSTHLGTTEAPGAAAQYAAPSAGVITSWSFRAGGAPPAFIRFKVARAAGGSNFMTTGQGGVGIPVADTLNTFSTRVPVQAGDVIGTFAPGTYACVRADVDYGIAGIAGDTAVGTTATFSLAADFQLDLSAQLEPDADGDGFGDETQDLCPSDADTQKACRDKAAPETTITTGPKAKTKSKQAEFAFSSSEAGSTFRCSLDGSGFELCESPRAYKVKPGKHNFTVIAKDAAGNVDETPATAIWTVKKKKKRK